MHCINLLDCLDVDGLTLYINNLKYTVASYGPKNKYLIDSRTGKRLKPFKQSECYLDQENANKLADHLQNNNKRLEEQVRNTYRKIVYLQDTNVGHEFED